MTLEMVRTLHENELLYFAVGSLISADYMVNLENCEKAKKELEYIKSFIPDLIFPTLEDREKLSNMIETCIEIEVENIKRFEKENYETQYNQSIERSINSNREVIGEAEKPSLETLVKALKINYIIIDCMYGGSNTDLSLEDEVYFERKAQAILDWWNDNN